MACKYCEELEDYLKYNVKTNENQFNILEDDPDVSLTELYFKYLGHDSRWDIPINFCPNCGKEINKPK